MNTDWATYGLELIQTHAPKVVGVLAILFLAWIVGGWVRRRLYKSLSGRFDETLARFFSKLARTLILVIAVISALQMFGIGATSFAAVLGASALAIGLAFQGSLGNFAAGVMLLIFRPFKVGDYVVAAGAEGTVDEIDLFVTTLDTLDNRRIVVPNGQIFTNTIENWSHHDNRRVDVNVGVDYGADMDKTRAVLTKACESVEGRLTKEGHQVVLVDLGDSAVNWQVRVFSDPSQYFAVKERLTHAVKKQLDDAKIEIPFPQTDINVKQPTA